MLLSNVIMKAEKLSGKKIQTNDVNQHWVTYKGYTVSFYPNGRIEADTHATGYYTKKIGVDDDITTDYHAGTFHDNISQAFRFIDRLVPDYRITWEMNVIAKMEEIGEMTTSDAQGQIMIREDLLNELFAKDATPPEAAKIIIDSCVIMPVEVLPAKRTVKLSQVSFENGNVFIAGELYGTESEYHADAESGKLELLDYKLSTFFEKWNDGLHDYTNLSSFQTYLMQAYQLADGRNRAYLDGAFPNYFINKS